MQTNPLYSAMLKFIVERYPLSEEDKRIIDDLGFRHPENIKEITAAFALVKRGIKPDLPKSIQFDGKPYDVVSASLIYNSYKVRDKDGKTFYIFHGDVEEIVE